MGQARWYRRCALRREAEHEGVGVGAVGEERLGARLDSLAPDDIAVLHDRRIPGTKANIDHIAITRGGIWVIDAKRYKGRPELKVEGGLLRPRVEKVLVGRRDCTKLVDGVLKQVDLVTRCVGDVSVTGALCFVEADWPLIGGAFTTRGVHAMWPKRLAKLLSEAEGSVDVAVVRDMLAAHFSPLELQIGGADEVEHETTDLRARLVCASPGARSLAPGGWSACGGRRSP